MRVGDSKQASIAGKQVDVEVLEILPPSKLYRDIIAGLLDADVLKHGLNISGVTNGS